jgi:tyrosyl-tRNA synthetase
MNFLEVMRQRGLIAQVNHELELEAHLAEDRRTAYMGFDPTGDSLHVGHFLSAMVLKRWQDSGHRVVVVMGGGTGLVGDPTGKTELRQMLSDDEIAHNISKFKEQLSRFINLDDPKQGIVVNNADWLMKLQYLPFIREYGQHFSVNRMLTAECFKQRLEKGLTFLEFNYMILQGYDFLELYRQNGVTVQLGGDDQWSNMLAGGELVRRVAKGKSFCLTFPLLTTSDGRKMGKTEGGAIWLDAEKTTPFDFFQYWRNVADADVQAAFLQLTNVSVTEIDLLCSAEGAAINEAKVRLAYEVTKIVHGESVAKSTRDTAASLFTQGGSTGEEPEVTISSQEFGQALGVLDLLTLSGIVPSKSEGRRLIDQGGVTINGIRVDDVKYMVPREVVAATAGCLIKKGKKHYYRLRILN